MKRQQLVNLNMQELYVVQSKAESFLSLLSSYVTEREMNKLSALNNARN